MDIYSAEAPTGAFLNINKLDGKSATMRFFGDPIMFEKTTDFNGKKETKTRFATLCLFRNKKTKESEIKAYEFGWTVQKALRQLHNDEDWGDPVGYDITISATGEGLTTEYQVVPRPRKDLSATDQELIKSCDINLRKVCKADEGGNDASPAADSDYSPFDDE